MSRLFLVDNPRRRPERAPSRSTPRDRAVPVIGDIENEIDWPDASPRAWVSSRSRWWARFNGRLCYTMPYCAGGSLRDRLRNSTREPWRRRRSPTEFLRVERVGDLPTITSAKSWSSPSAPWRLVRLPPCTQGNTEKWQAAFPTTSIIHAGVWRWRSPNLAAVIVQQDRRENARRLIEESKKIFNDLSGKLGKNSEFQEHLAEAWRVKDVSATT